MFICWVRHSSNAVVGNTVKVRVGCVCRPSIVVGALHFFELSRHLMKKIATLDMNICMKDGILIEASRHAMDRAVFELWVMKSKESTDGSRRDIILLTKSFAVDLP
jgi:hypothetical protein